MPNIKFNYLYRDSANYKNFNSVIFKNDPSISIVELEALIRSKLIYGEWFYAIEWNLPELFSSHWDFKIDPTWHEFESVEYADENPITVSDLNEFMQLLINCNNP